MKVFQCWFKIGCNRICNAWGGPIRLQDGERFHAARNWGNTNHSRSGLESVISAQCNQLLRSSVKFLPTYLKIFTAWNQTSLRNQTIFGGKQFDQGWIGSRRDWASDNVGHLLNIFMCSGFMGYGVGRGRWQNGSWQDSHNQMFKKYVTWNFIKRNINVTGDIFKQRLHKSYA